ncbi:hypothetical protein KIW84_074144 [Lathyrus oleraceus]|uniref:Uncharacterized protein n=1 Tax=Pisum sativum TaxID=3888 RepID=A0A9D4VSZ5_PEA|nr:hypothetical protein KIW84_074144 [Pisum sativum]
MADNSSATSDYQNKDKEIVAPKTCSELFSANLILSKSPPFDSMGRTTSGGTNLSSCIFVAEENSDTSMEDISNNYMCYSTAKKLWGSVTEMYSGLGNKSRIYELTLQAKEIRQGGLNEELDEVRGRVIGRATIPSLSEVFAEVGREETKRNVMMGIIKIVPPPPETNALTAETTALKSSTNHKNFSNLWRDHSNKPRHTRETCWKIHGRPSHLKVSKLGPKVHRPFPTAHEAEKTSLRKEQVEELVPRIIRPVFLLYLKPILLVLEVKKLELQMDRTSGKMIGSAKMMDGLYYFEHTFENK